MDFLIHHNNGSVVLSFTPLNGNGSESPTLELSGMAQRFYDPSKIVSFSSVNLTHTVMKTLKDIIGHETRNYELDNGKLFKYDLEVFNLWGFQVEFGVLQCH